MSYCLHLPRYSFVNCNIAQTSIIALGVGHCPCLHYHLHFTRFLHFPDPHHRFRVLHLHHRLHIPNMHQDNRGSYAEHRKDKCGGGGQHPYKRKQCVDIKCWRLRILGTTLEPLGKEPGQRDTTKNHGRLGGICQTPGHLQKQPSHLPEERGV